MTAQNPELTDPNELARHELGNACAGIIGHLDALSHLSDSQSSVDISREESVVSALYPDVMSSNLALDSITLADGSEYSIAALRSDDANAMSDRGAFNIDDPKAYYRMTFRKVQDTPEGSVDLEAFSVEMARASSRQSGGSSNPSSLIIWNLDEPGEAEYLQGDEILNSSQFGCIKEIETILAAEEDKAYARMLYE